MHPGRAAFLTAAVLAGRCQFPAEPACAQPVAGVDVWVEVLKKSHFEREAGRGPVVIGPQSALELEWRLSNWTGRTVEVAAPAAAFRLRVWAAGRAIPVHTEWAAEMTVRSANVQVGPETVPNGSTALPDGVLLRVRGSTKRLDGSAFGPGEYVLKPDLTAVEAVSAAGARSAATVNPASSIDLRIVPLDSPERQRLFHMIEGAFYEGVDTNRALEHALALASLPGAPWSDSLGLARLYVGLGRRREAAEVYRRILPDLVGALDEPLAIEIGPALRYHLRKAAGIFAAEGDVATAAFALRAEGRTPEDRIAEEIERLRKWVARPR